MTFVTMLSLMAVCAIPQIRNLAYPVTWTSFDQHTLQQAYKGCKRHYGNESPCVRVFIKKRHQEYQVICGGQKSTTSPSKGE